ncbi:MAG: choice-of-anchor Q domain-containing protein [Candidatus Cloacimonadales bacterium]|nr:choice-of-anchor Q domain-containing protein [Candidatus Cloacimonadales bacterium]
MKIRFLLFCNFCLFCSLLISTTWHIKQDGTGAFTTIQEGINASSNSDTVLVYPGTYNENINYNGKCITVGSLYLTTGDEQYINQTIIDGNQSNSCVRILSCGNGPTVLCGFSLTNGIGSDYYTGNVLWGGGVFVFESQSSLIACKIYGNNAHAGGGIYVWDSFVYLSKLHIADNHAYAGGGGIGFGSFTTAAFDPVNLCNIYLNFAGVGAEIQKSWVECPPIEVFVDTFTVENPDAYFIFSTDGVGIPQNDVTLNMQHAKLEPVNADLYVSTEGDNNNNGISEDEPLATINYALSLVKSDSLHPNTIHISDGVYSKSLNIQCFPLNMRGYVSLQGESMENTILDAESKSPLIYDHYSKQNYSITDMKFIHGFGEYFVASCMLISVSYNLDSFINLENITITDFNYCIGRILEIFYVDLSFENLRYYSNYKQLLRALNSYRPDQEVVINNAYINNNPAHPSAGANHKIMQFGQLGTNTMNVNITNMELTENNGYHGSPSIGCSGIEVRDNINMNLINCTLANNVTQNEGGVIRMGLTAQNSVVNIYNSILYGNLPSEIYIDNDNPNEPCALNIYNSLVAGGETGIENVHAWNSVNWHEGNLNENPMFDSLGIYPFALTSSSPCIDAGTLDLPEGIELPEYDLAGNARIYGDTVDMGAYEWQGTGVEEEEIPQLSSLKTQLSNYPNPFNPSTTIKLELAESGEMELAIYNVKGQKVKTLINAITNKGTFEINWRGKDDHGKPVSSGQYIIKLIQNNKVTATKIMLLK